MRVRVAVFTLIVVCLASTGSAQTSTSLGVRLYGFVFPELAARDYIVSLSAHYDSGEAAFEAIDPTAGFDTEYERLHVRLAGVLAMTDRTFLGVNVLFYPEQTLRTLEYASSEYAYISGEEQPAYLRPEITLAVRPGPTLEMYASWSREARSSTYTYHGEPSGGDIAQVTDDWTTISAGINYYGSFGR
jgi:hypothetical protein